MNSQLLESFLKIVEMGSISAAADTLFISQSTLSDRLKALEEDLGVTLINRGPGIKQIELTERGVEFLSYTNRFLDLDKEVQQWKNYDHLQSLRMGAPMSINSLFFRNFFKQFLNSNRIYLNVSAHWNRTIYSMVNVSELDLGVVSRPYQSQNMKTIPLFREPIMIVYDNDYADYEDLSELDIRDQIFIEWGPHFTQWYQQHWPAQDTPKISLDSPELLMEYISSDQSWAAVPMCLYNSLLAMNDKIQVLELEEEVYRELYLIYQPASFSSGYTARRAFMVAMFEFVEECARAGLCESLIDLDELRLEWE